MSNDFSIPSTGIHSLKRTGCGSLVPSHGRPGSDRVEQIKSCGVPYQDLKKSMDEDLEVLSKFYARNEWSSDRPCVPPGSPMRAIWQSGLGTV